MFKQLSPLLSTRSLVLTATLLDADRIRVTITPRSTGKDDPKELSQPFAVEGTAEELDNELPAAIAAYTTEHMSLARSLELIKSNMDAALKAAKAEADKKVADAKKEVKPGAKAKPEPEKLEVKKVEEPSLFDLPAIPQSVTPTATEPASVASDAEKPAPVESPSQRSPLFVQKPAEHSSGPVPAEGGMFDNPNEEEEILKEAFYGSQDNLIAA